jgi:hypothetical protein
MGKKVEKPADSSVPAPIEVSGDYLLNELEGNKHVDEKIREIVKHFISSDKDVDQEIQKIVDKIERDRMKIFWTKIGAAVWSILMILLGVALSAVARRW